MYLYRNLHYIMTTKTPDDITIIQYNNDLKSKIDNIF